MSTRLIFLLFTVLAACSPFQVADPLPVTQTIEVAITPTLLPLTEVLQACVSEQDDVILDLLEMPTESLMSIKVDLYFRLGEPQSLPAFLAPIAWEEIVVIRHPSNSKGALDQTQLRSIFSGYIGGEDGSDFQVWVPLEGNEARLAFDDVVLSGGLVSSLAKLAPDPAAMLAEVSSDPGAIGYLPKAWLTEEVQTLGLGIRLPLLALANEEPKGPALILISCLQSEAGQEAIEKWYSRWSE